MKILNKHALIGSLMTLIAIPAMAAETIKVGFAAEPYPPFSYTAASGNWKGWEIELMAAICESAKLDCKITPIAWDGIIPALNSKKIDIIMASMSITPDRLKVIDFSDKYYNTPAVIVGDKNVDIGTTAQSMKG